MKKKMKASELKYLAMLAMFLDHYAVILVEESSFTYVLFRSIGRIAFPIFAFFIVEGFKKTKNLKAYLFNLFILGLLSEVPFNLMVGEKFFEPNYQNVYFTLFLGLCMLTCLDKSPENKGIDLLIIVGFSYLSYILRTDYSIFVPVYMALIFGLDQRLDKFVSAGLLFITTPWALVGIYLVLYAYNGERGKQDKLFNYLFYPLHILVLYLISVFL